MEIGSEFWDVPTTNTTEIMVHDNTKWFISGRSALTYILKIIKLQSNVKCAALPEWCCDSVIIPFINENISVVFYSVFSNGKLKQDIKGFFDNDILLVMDYFGFQNSPLFDNYNGIVIRDLTHSLFIKDYRDADYYFGSFRKWCGVWTGGFAWAIKGWNYEKKIEEPSIQYISLRKSAMEQKRKYIQKRTNSKNFLMLFSKAEEYLERNNRIQGAAKEDIYSLKKLDISFIKKMRRENAMVLIEGLKTLEISTIFSTIEEDDCPMFIPILTKDRNKVREKLIENGIYCPVHWPITSYHNIKEEIGSIYNSEISLICDQRYNIKDMERLLKCLQMIV